MKDIQQFTLLDGNMSVMLMNDALEERAGILEFDAGLTRFQAETIAARQHAMIRKEAFNENGARDLQGTWNKR